MLTYVRLRNFMSFKDVMFNFKSTKSSIKNFVSIYGENGSGKSNFVASISFLRKSIDSFNLALQTDKLRDYLKGNEISKDVLDSILYDYDFDLCRNECRMIDSDEDCLVEYGFSLNGYEGYYVLSFDNSFKYEKLYYFIGKQRNNVFEIDDRGTSKEVYFSNKLFNNKKAEEEIREEIDKYWGKHSLLSIFNRERDEKNIQYIENSFHNCIYDVIDMFEDITVHYKKTPERGSEILSSKPSCLLGNLYGGKIKDEDIDLLNRSELILRSFFTQAYADIKDVYYEKKISETYLEYKLFVKKMIGGKIRAIPFDKESAGTQHILNIIHSLLGVFSGLTVVYDEIDNGIHDLLLKGILESMKDEITGQLIITTHNTYLMESMDIKSIYLILVDYLGNKSVKSLDDYPRIQGTNNPRLMYMKGMFGGIPVVDSLDYDEIVQELVSDNQKGEQ